MRPSRHSYLILFLQGQDCQVEQTLFSGEKGQDGADIAYFGRVAGLEVEAFLVFEGTVDVELAHLGS